MSEEMQGRDIRVGDDDIIVYDIDNPNSWYSAVYQNKDTRALDERFGLTGEPVDKDSEVAYCLNVATGSCSLGKTEVEFILRYFAGLAKQAGNFVGLPEEEVRKHVRDKDLTIFFEGDIDTALTYRDGMNEGETYLKRINVEGKDILFPANLKKLLF